MHSGIWPMVPGAILGYRKNGTPVRLIAGGSDEGDGDGSVGQDGGTGYRLRKAAGQAAISRRTPARPATVAAARAATTRPRRSSRRYATTTPQAAVPHGLAGQLGYEQDDGIPAHRCLGPGYPG